MDFFIIHNPDWIQPKWIKVCLLSCTIRIHSRLNTVPTDLWVTSSVKAAGKPRKKSGQLLIPVTEKAGRRWVEYRKLRSLDLWTWAKSSNAKTTSTVYLFTGERLQRFVVIFWVFRVGNLIEQREDVSGSHPAQPAEAGRKTHHPQRQRHRDVDPRLQYKEG